MDHSRATTVLEKALRDVSEATYQPRSPLTASIASLIAGPDLTFRYILLTGLLAKATDPKASARALQAGSKLTGAYDARSLCHSVVVPFERKHLNGALGESNEPFLNKPARFTEVDLGNATKRKGTLKRLYDVLRAVDQDPSLAPAALAAAIHSAIQRSRPTGASVVAPQTLDKRYEILDFIDCFLKESVEGESATLTMGALVSLASRWREGRLRTVVHPSNQSGASSRGVSDIDVLDGDKLHWTVEVKDKAFSSEDVEHAVSRAQNSGHASLIFATGPRGGLLDSSASELRRKAAKRGVELSLIPVRAFADTVLALAPSATPADFVALLLEHAAHARVKDATRTRIQLCAAEVGWFSEG